MSHAGASDGNRAIVHLNKRAYDRQPDAKAPLCKGSTLGKLPKHVEYPLSLFGRDANAVVNDMNNGVAFISRGINEDRSALWRVLDCIVQ